MTRRKPKKGSVDFDVAIVLSADLAEEDDCNRAEGFSRAGDGRARRERGGQMAVTFRWRRKHAGCIETRELTLRAGEIIVRDKAELEGVQ